MKEIYEKPITSIEEFKTVDVITESTNPGDDNDTPFPFG